MKGLRHMDTNDWQGILDEMDAAKANADVYYLKEKKTRLRLVVAPGSDPRHFFAETTKSYKGKQGTAYLIYALVIATSKGSGDKNVSPTKVRAVRIAKTALRAIVSQLAEGHELFDPAQGHAVVVEKIEGETTSYTVSVAPKAMPVVLDELEWPKTEDDAIKLLPNIAAAESVRAVARDEKKMQEEGKPVSRNQPRDVSLGDDEDEDEPPF